MGLGGRLEASAIPWSDEEQDRKQGRSQEEVTMEVVRTAADSVVEWLDFTMDLPQYHGSGMVPMLDLQVWVQHPTPEMVEEGLSSDLVMWIFFEKSMSSARVLRANSAFTWRCKLTTMGMEVFRRMRNTSRQASLSTRANIIDKFTVKLRSSGYSLKTVSGILESGLRFYYRKLRTDLEGGPGLNVRREDNTISKRRTKMGAKSEWFKRRRGGIDERCKKESGWRRTRMTNQEGGEEPVRIQNPRRGGVRRGHAQRPTTSCKAGPGRTGTPAKEDDPQPGTIMTLLVPYTTGSRLQKAVQQSEDQFVAMIGCQRVRVVEQGGGQARQSDLQERSLGIEESVYRQQLPNM